MTETLSFDPASYLTSHKAQNELLREALESGDAAFITVALGTVARARSMSEVALEAGVTREALHRSLSPEGDPRLSTLLSVLRALGVRLSAQMKAAE